MFLGITGGTGFIGQALQEAASARDHNILLFSRHPQSLPGARSWSQTTIPDLSGCDQLVHLAGESILGLWTAEKRQRILESRREGTRRLVEGIAKASVKPSVLVSASAIGYYGNGGDTILDETAPGGSGFLAEIAQAWEEEALKAEAYGVRVVLVRIGIVLGATGGIMKLITPLFRLGLGGILGSGRQWMSCIHVKDLAELILKFANDPSIHGPVNAVMPHPLTNTTFTKTIGALLHRPTFLRTPALALRLGLGELSTLLLGSQRILPTKALEHGYDFQYPTVESALKEIFIAP
ncbi:MAG: TIGR01777 family oxidoreductase [Chthoniobacterales bacterium]